MAGTPRPNTNYAEEIVADVPQTCWCRGREALDLLAEPSKVNDAFDSALFSKTQELISTGKLGQTDLPLVKVESKFLVVTMGHAGSVAWKKERARGDGGVRPGHWRINRPSIQAQIVGIHAARPRAAQVRASGLSSEEGS